MEKKAKAEETSQIVFDEMDTALNAGESFIEKNLTPILIGLAAILLVIVAIFGVKSLVLEPKEQEAKESIYKAEQLFAKDSFQVALDEFLGIIDEYGSTDAGELAYAYAGLCYKQLGDNENAIKFLDKFSADENTIQPAILGAMGDCYWDMQNTDKAISYYKKAASYESEMMTPFYRKRAALVYLSINENDKALELLQSIEKEYPRYPEMNDVKKFIELAK